MTRMPAVARRTPGRRGRVLALLATLVVAAACTMGEILRDYGDPVDMQPSDLVGTWYSNSGSGGSGSRLFRFEEDGSFSATDLPESEYGSFLPPGADATAPIDGEGTWSLEPPRRDPDGPTATVDLRFSQLAGRPAAGSTHLSALRQDGTVFLVMFDAGDGYGWFAYQKCTRDCPSPAAGGGATEPGSGGARTA